MTIENFNATIYMFWLNPHHTNTICYEKAVQLKLPHNNTLFIYDVKSDTNLRIVPCIKDQKYLGKRYHTFP